MSDTYHWNSEHKKKRVISKYHELLHIRKVDKKNKEIKNGDEDEKTKKIMREIQTDHEAHCLNSDKDIEQNDETFS